MKKFLLYLALCAAAFGQTIPASPGIFNLSASSGGGGGSGTVTSVSFTGGLITVSSPTTTPSFTVAGTSGGIPYFSSASTWASSGVLALNSILLGGGAGGTPTSTTTGTGVVTALGVNVGSAGAFVTFNGALGTPSSGTVTNLTGTASININGTVGATTPAAGTFSALTDTANTFTLGSTARTIVTGAGSPESAITASVGALYLRNDGAAGTTLYSKTSGSATNTGWTAFGTGGSGTVSSGTTNTLSKYTAATTVGDSLVSDNGTTLTYTGTGGITASGPITAGGSGAGAIVLPQGSAQTAGTTNITIQAPVAVTSYLRTLPGAAATGFYLGTNSAGTVTDTQVASTGTGNVVLSASPTLTGTIGGASLTLSSLTSGRVAFAGASGLLSDDSDMTFATDTLTVTKIIGSTSITDSNLTSGRITYAGTAGILSDKPGLTFDGTATVTVGLAGTSVGGVSFANATSGAITINAPTGALGTVANTLQAAADTFVYRATADTLTNKKVDFGSSLATDDTFVGEIISGLNNSGGVTQWDAVYLNSSSQWVKADANGSGTYPAVGIATATATTGNPTTVLVRGLFRDDGGTSWTVGGNTYLSTTAGAMTSTPPSTTGDKVQVIGTALAAHTVYVHPGTDYGTAP